ncbi:MAG TPA: type II and III secretion system protein family protein [Longimicrobiaceae bacterium]
MTTRARYLLLLLAALLGPVTGAARAVGQTPVGEALTIARGTSTLVTSTTPIQRVSIGDPEVADAVVVSTREVLVNAKKLGSTTLIVWDTQGGRSLYQLEVTVDAAALERQLRTLFPTQQIAVTASGNILILSGRVTDASVARRALEIARGTGATVIENLSIPPARQVLLQVRFAEVSRSSALQLGTRFGGGETSARLNPETPSEGDTFVETLSDGLVRLLLFNDNVQFSALVEALQTRGLFRSLAEPNLLAIEGKEASFLAGGEIPIPVPQGGQSNTVVVQFKEFGIRLRFTPRVTIAGNIRLEVAPEVSSLDYANAIQFSGFLIPALRTRRADTEIELRPGQTFAIAGLMDNAIQNNRGKIPFLGDIPILGPLFRSRDMQQSRTELLVLVTPQVVQPGDQTQAVPTGEPETWEWDRPLRGAPPQGRGRPAEPLPAQPQTQP